MSMTLIETIELGSSQASITFSSIPQTYTDLKVVYSVRSNTGGTTGGSIKVNFNGDSNTANYDTIQLRGTGSASESNTRTTTPGEINGTGTTSNTFSSAQMYVSNYTSTTNKSISHDLVSENNATAAFQHISAMLYTTSSAITSLSILNDDSLASGCTFSLYGITAGSDGTTTVS